MYYVLVAYDGERWSAHGCDEFEHRDEEVGTDGQALDRLKHRTFHRVQELNGGNAIIVKWLYTNLAYRHYHKLLNEHVKKPDDAGAKLLAEAIGDDDQPD